MSEIKHSALPWEAAEDIDLDCFVVDSKENSVLRIDSPSDYAEQDALFIVEACNNYYKIKEQNEKLKEALSSIKIHIDFCGDESWAESLQSSREYKQMVEALKSCES